MPPHTPFRVFFFRVVSLRPCRDAAIFTPSMISLAGATRAAVDDADAGDCRCLSDALVTRLLLIEALLRQFT